MDVFGWILTGFAGLTAILVGWQIYMTVSVYRIINRRVKKALDKKLPIVVAEATGTSFYRIAEQAMRIGDKALALSLYINAACNLSKVDGFQEEVSLCVDFLIVILNNIDPTDETIVLSDNQLKSCMEMIAEIKEDRSDRVFRLFMEVVAARQKFR